MAYCTKADIVDELDEDILIQLTDDAGLGTVDDDKVTAAITRADNEIDSYVGVKHSVPVSPTPPRLKDVSVALAIYHLYGRRKGAPEQQKDAYEKGLAWLRDVSTGKASIGAGDPDTPPVDTEKPQIASNDPIFGRDNMDDF